MAKKLKVIDLFCGAGGLSFGFANHKAFEIVAANEILPSMAAAYLLNHPTIRMYVEDIKHFSAQRVERDLGTLGHNVDIVVGSPPCQAYSTVGKRMIDDPRGKLFVEYYRMLKEFKPKFFLFENVKGLLSMQGGELHAEIISLFESLGYRVQSRLLNAADYGAPQIRERVIITGSKLAHEFKYPAPTHYDPMRTARPLKAHLQPYLTIADAMSDLPLIQSGEESTVYATPPRTKFQSLMRTGAPSKLMDHNAPTHNQKLVRLMQLLPDGGTPDDLPKRFRPSSGFKNTYCRLWWNRPSTTITRNLGTPSSSRCIHPKAPRALTTREGARLQCFPDWYQFYGTRSERNLQIGNAVPTVLSSALAKAIYAHFSETKHR